MTNSQPNSVTDTDIFLALRKQANLTTMSQIIVDITNKAMEVDSFRDDLIKRLGVAAQSAITTVGRDYNLTLNNLKLSLL